MTVVQYLLSRTQKGDRILNASADFPIRVRKHFSCVSVDAQHDCEYQRRLKMFFAAKHGWKFWRWAAIGLVFTTHYSKTNPDAAHIPCTVDKKIARLINETGEIFPVETKFKFKK